MGEFKEQVRTLSGLDSFLFRLSALQAMGSSHSSGARDWMVGLGYGKLRTIQKATRLQ